MNENKEPNVENNNTPKEVVKRKTNWGFTLFACIATGVIVFLAMNIGEKAGKIVAPETNGSSSNVTSNSDSNSNSNEVSNSNVTSNTTSNVTSDVTSNATSNPTSNVTSNVTSNTTQSTNNNCNAVSVRTYRFFGYTVGNDPDMYTTLKLYSNGKYDLYVNACSHIEKTSGNYKETDASIALMGAKKITFTKKGQGTYLEFDFAKLDACNNSGGTFSLESSKLN